MKRIQHTPTAPVSSDRFSGHAWVDTLATGEPPSRLRLAVVWFEPGARTAWHRHAVGQTLHTTDGFGVVRNRDGETILLRAGETVHTPPGEWHWHGAVADHFMSHLAVSETADDPDTADVEWSDHVSATEYREALERLNRALPGAAVDASV
jgi:quercetin dioxygenase-like cupin family protein